jgi:hypothetical protein
MCVSILSERSMACKSADQILQGEAATQIFLAGCGHVIEI